jgi:hypothetical protein
MTKLSATAQKQLMDLIQNRVSSAIKRLEQDNSALIAELNAKARDIVDTRYGTAGLVKRFEEVREEQHKLANEEANLRNELSITFDVNTYSRYNNDGWINKRNDLIRGEANKLVSQTELGEKLAELREIMNNAQFSALLAQSPQELREAMTRINEALGHTPDALERVLE